MNEGIMKNVRGGYHTHTQKGRRITSYYGPCGGLYKRKNEKCDANDRQLMWSDIISNDSLMYLGPKCSNNVKMCIKSVCARPVILRTWD
jgi:hypothetical protein